jgi:hypothetical protein
MSLRRAVYMAGVIAVCRGVSPGAFELNPADPRTLALRNVCPGFGVESWGAFGNPAGLAYSRSVQAGFFYMPGLFGMPELACYGAGVTVPIAGISTGVSSTMFGFDPYKERVLGIALGGEVSSGISFGVRCKANGLAVRGYGSSTTLTLDAGICVHCGEDIAFGGICTNVTSSDLGQTGELLPQELSGGICYKPSPGASIFVSLNKEIVSPLELCFGVEAKVAEPLSLRFSVNAERPSVISAGCGVQIAGASFDYAYVYHWILGATHEIGVSVAL